MTWRPARETCRAPMSIPAGLTRRTAISVTEEGASNARHGDRQGEQGFGSGRAAEPRDSQRDGQVQRGAGEGRRDAGGRGAALERQGPAGQAVTWRERSAAEAS